MRHPYQFQRIALAKSGMRVVFTHRAELVYTEHYVFVPMPYLIHDDVLEALCIEHGRQAPIGPNLDDQRLFDFG